MVKNLINIRAYGAMLLTVCAFMISSFGVVKAMAANSANIAVVVNEDAILESDIDDRMRMMMTSAGLPNNADVRERMRPQIISLLVDEKLKLQEAARLGLEITDGEIEQGFNTIAAQNNFEPAQFRNILARSGVKVSTIKEQIRAQIAWTKVLQDELQPSIIISDNEVDAVVNRIARNEGKTEYLVAEIFLALDSDTNESELRRLAERLTTQITNGESPFQRVAAQFSQSATASRGGDIGWVQEGQLEPALEDMILRMNEGKVSPPIKTNAGYHILFLRGKREITAESVPAAELVRQQIGMERLDRMQRNYLLDLRSSAFIEERTDG